MSHFTVGVLVDRKGKKLEELLAPYQENNMGDCPKEFLKFSECEQDEIDEYEKHKEDYKNLDEFMDDYHGAEKDDTTGKYGLWENPNAEWDWYVIGGRWSNGLLTKIGVKVDYAMLKDIDWDSMKAKSIKNAEETWDSNPQGIERYFAGIQKNDTRDIFIKRESEFTTYAVITPDGKWHSKGEMGWFGCSSETGEEANKWAGTFHNAFIKNADQELILVIVDCHI